VKLWARVWYLVFFDSQCTLSSLITNAIVERFVLGNGETAAAVVVRGGVVARTFARRLRAVRLLFLPDNLHCTHSQYMGQRLEPDRSC